MEGITAAISLAGAGIAFVLGPVGALFTYFMVMFYYPQSLTLPLGNIQFSSGRIVILGVLANALLRGGHLRRLKLDMVDFWIAVQFVTMTIAFMVNVDAMRVLEGRGGMFFDTIMPYIAVRLMVDDKKKLVSLIKWTTVCLVPLAMLGIFEARTGHNPYSVFARYQSWGLATESSDPNYMRHGLYRASSSIGNYISFGMLFAGFAPLALSLWHDRKWSRMLTLAVTGGLLIGLVSSMSSGPLFSISVSLGMLALFRFRDKWPLFTVVVLACMVFVEVFSNRHFYYVLTLFAFDPDTAYYRIGLIEECFGGGMAGHWFAGYGYVGIGPGNDNTHFLWEHQDLTNIYIRYLARTGLLATIPFLVINFLYYLRLYQAARHAPAKSDAWLIWCLAASLVGWNISMMTVSALAQIETLLFMFIALCVNMPAIMRQEAAAARQPLPAAAPPEAPAVGEIVDLTLSPSRGRLSRPRGARKKGGEHIAALKGLESILARRFG